MKIKTLKWIIKIFNTLALGSIVFFFISSFFFPQLGPLFIIYAACSLLLIGILIVSVHFLERRSKQNHLALATTRHYLTITLRIILIVIGSVSIFMSLLFFVFTGSGYFLVNSGCIIAFIMIIILIELFIKILLPLAGIDQHV